MTPLKSIGQVISTMKSMQGFTNRNNFRIVERDPRYEQAYGIDDRNLHYVQVPQNVVEQKRGFCYDQSYVAKHYLDSLGIPNRMFFSCTDNLKTVAIPEENGGGEFRCYQNGVISHVFITYQAEGIWKWMQWSWVANINNTCDSKTIEELLGKYTEIAERSWHNKIILTCIDGITPGKPRLQFLNECISRPRICTE